MIRNKCNINKTASYTVTDKTERLKVSDGKLLANLVNFTQKLGFESFYNS